MNTPVPALPDKNTVVNWANRYNLLKQTPLTMVPGDYPPCLEEFRADIITGVKERVWFTYYDSNIVDKTDAATQEGKFFVNIQGKTLIETNMPTSGVLPDPEVFVVHYVSSYIYPQIQGQSSVFNDLTLIANNTVFTMRVNQKKYYQSLSWDIPSGGGQRGFAMPASASTDELMWNGDVSQISMKRLRIPVIIRRSQQFVVEYLIDNRAWNVLTDNAQTWWYFLLHGELYRAVT